MTPREIVQAALRFKNPPRLPRDLWVLPWANDHIGEAVEELKQRWPGDFGNTPQVYRPSSKLNGDRFTIGEFIDEWGCVFENLMAGVIGEVRHPLIEDIEDWQTLQPPYEVLPADVPAAIATVNRACRESDKFIKAGCCPRPWERYQFIRTTEEAMMDMADPDEDVRGLIGRIHEYYMAELAFWVKTDVDAVFFMDDWGSQNQLLINPKTWREIFKPLYKDYIDIAHRHGKFALMHSDGCIIEIYPDLIELGLDAINSQLFTMDLKELSEIARGKITFWGEIDRQHALIDPTGEAARNCVRQVYENLYLPEGGIIIQFESGLGATPASVLGVMDEWDKLTSGVHA